MSTLYDTCACSERWHQDQQEMLASCVNKQIGEGVLRRIVANKNENDGASLMQDDMEQPINLCTHHVDRTLKMQSMADVLRMVNAGAGAGAGLTAPLQRQEQVFDSILSNLSPQGACGFVCEGPLSADMANMLPDFIEGLLDKALDIATHVQKLIVAVPVGPQLQNMFNKLLDCAVIKHNSAAQAYCMIDHVSDKVSCLEESQETQGKETAECQHMWVIDNQCVGSPKTLSNFHGKLKFSESANPNSINRNSVSPLCRSEHAKMDKTLATFSRTSNIAQVNVVGMEAFITAPKTAKNYKHYKVVVNDTHLRSGESHPLHHGDTIQLCTISDSEGQ